MVPFKETINTKQELIEACKKGFEDYTNRRISKNDFCMYFGFTHGKAITTFYEGNYEQLLIDGGFNSGSSAYFSAGINAWKNLRDDIYTFPPYSQNDSRWGILDDEPLQQIFYGAPGTGKSYKIKELTGKANVIRTTFHPDSDYSTFVGCYKPTMRPVADKYKAVAGKDEDIAYEFVPQAFLKAYTSAWKNQEKPFYLIIEEINRGNCAQIFGDLFQLLDRNKNGYSDYPISPDEDIQKFLKTDKKYGFAELMEEQKNSIPAKIQSGDEMCLPNNLHIWATMNTSDQSLFPIDSAFKRRWDWKYMPIDTKKERWSITVEGVNYSWTSFLDVVNKRIYGATMSEDKQLGFYFCKAQDNVVCAQTFVSKVLFYLWNDVFKDYDESESIFKDSNGAKLSFSDFYKSNGDIDESTVTKLLVALEVSKEGVSDNVDYDNDLTLDEEDAEESEGKDYTRYTINGQGEYPKRQLSTQAVRKYIEIHPELTAEQVVANWMTLGNIVSHFIETKEQFDARTDISKRSNEVPCGNSMIYVAWNGWGSQDKMQTLINAVNNKDWGIKLAIKE